MKNNLKKIRCQRELTIFQLAQKSYVSPFLIARIEFGITRNIPLWPAYRLAYALQVHLLDIFS